LKILVVSDREYKKTSRGIDIITTLLAENGFYVDHLVFFRRKRYPEKQVTDNIRQLYMYDCIKLYRGKLQFLFPGFLLLAYFHYIIKKSKIDFQQYEYVVLESGHPLYLAMNIQNKIIYRQSDPTHICFNSNRKFYLKLESKVIKKAIFVTSALNNEFYIPGYKDKIFFWHSGFIPCIKDNEPNPDRYFVIMGGELDWKILKKMAIHYPDYNFFVIGIPGRKMYIKNIILKGYLEYNEYQKLLSSALLTIIPFSDNYVRKLRQVSFTAKIFTSMQLGMPILLRAYGNIQYSDINKKLYVYKTKKDALCQIDTIIKDIKNGNINYEVSKETQDFLFPQTAENRTKELESLFLKWIKSTKLF
jgi:hypothetical protein